MTQLKLLIHHKITRTITIIDYSENFYIIISALVRVVSSNVHGERRETFDYRIAFGVSTAHVIQRADDVRLRTTTGQRSCRIARRRRQVV